MQVDFENTKLIAKGNNYTVGGNRKCFNLITTSDVGMLKEPSLSFGLVICQVFLCLVL